VPLELVENELRRFLASSEPEVICISGHWGVGKTFAWKRHLQEAKANNAIALKRYSYVSLFGVNSLDDLKYSIFENTVGSSDVGIEPSLETFQTNTTAVAKRLGRKSLRFLQQLPVVKNYVGSLGPAWFLSVKEMVVCLDDVERRGDSLTTREILGLVSALKEQKRCKVALILNDEALETEKEEFRKYYEKVVDVSLAYSPSAAECVNIALDKSSKASTLLAQHCVMLGISNIRLIKRIERSVLAIAKLLEPYDEKVFENAVQSLALFAWSVYEPSRAPSVQFLDKQSTGSGFEDKKSENLPEKEVAWRALLRAYGFTHLDEFDRVLLDGTKNGYFDVLAVERCATALDREVKAAKLNNSFWQAWGMYHDSFDENQDRVLDAIYESFLKSAQYITPTNMNSTVILFKALGRPMQAAEMIRVYVECGSGERELFKPGAYPFFGETPDPDVTKAFEDQSSLFPISGILVTEVFSPATFFLTSLPNSAIHESASALSGRAPFCSLYIMSGNPFVSATLPVSRFVCKNLHRIVQ